MADYIREVALYTGSVDANLPSGTVASLTIARHDDVKASVHAVGGLDGRARFQLARPDPGDLEAWQRAVLQPGDTLILAVGDSAPMTTTVPLLFADMDRRGVVTGLAPPGTAVRLRLVQSGIEVATAVATADATGLYEYAWSRQMHAADETRVAIDAEGGVVVGTRAVAFGLEVRLGSNAIDVQSSTGVQLRIDVLTADGQRKGNADGYFALPDEKAASATALVFRRFLVATPSGTGYVTLDAGDRIIVSRDGYVGDDKTRFETVLPPLRLEMTASDAFRVVGAPDASVNWTIEPPMGPSITGERTLDADGAGIVDVPVPPGARIEVSVAVTDEVRASRWMRRRQLWLGLHTPSFAVVSNPGTAYGLTLHDPSGEVAATANGVMGIAADRGVAAGVFRGPAGTIRAEPGMRVVGQIDGLEIDIRVPDLGAVPERDGVTGRATTARSVWAWCQHGCAKPGPGADRASAVEAMVAEDGTFRTPMSFAATGGPGHGVVAADLPGGHFALLHWARPTIRVEFGPPLRWSGLAVAAGGSAELDVAGQGGEVRDGVRADARPPASPRMEEWLSGLDPSPWRWSEAETVGTASELRSGDRVYGSIGGAVIDVEVPPLTFDVDAMSGRVHGRTCAGCDVEVRSRDRIVAQAVGSEPVVGQGRADSSGAFDVPLDAGFARRGAQRITLASQLPAGHTFERSVELDAVVIHLDEGLLVGRGPESASMVAAVRGSDGRTARAEGDVDRYGDFRLQLRDVGGNARPLEAGDELTIDVAGRALRRLIVPEVEVTLTTRNGLLSTIRGTGKPGREAEITLGELANPASSDGAAIQVVPGADGRFETGLVNANGEIPIIRPGSAVRMAQWADDYFRLTRRSIVPQLAVEIGGARLAVLADPGVAADVEVGQPGATHRARGTTMAPTVDVRLLQYVSTWLVLRDGGGQPVHVESGAQVRASVGGAEVVWRLPSLDAEADWTQGSVSGQWRDGGGIDATVTDACREPGNREGFYGQRSATADAAGVFTIAGLAVEPGQAITYGGLDEGGHRAFGQRIRPMIAAHVGTPRVEGCLSPLARGTLRLHDEGGDVLAESIVQADEDGRWAASLVDPAGAAVAVQPTQRVSLDADERVEVPLRGVALALDDDGLRGRADHDHVTVRIGVADDPGSVHVRVIEQSLPVDSDGNFGWPDSDARAFQWTDVVWARAAIALTSVGGIDGYAAVATVARNPASRAVILPWLARQGGSR